MKQTTVYIAAAAAVAVAVLAARQGRGPISGAVAPVTGDDQRMQSMFRMYAQNEGQQAATRQAVINDLNNSGPDPGWGWV